MAEQRTRYGFDDVHSQIAIARRILARNGCDSSTGGHVSVRADGEDAFWITPYQYFDETVPADVGKMGFDGVQREGERELPTAGSAIHGAVYMRRPDVSSVVHLHSHFISVWSTTGKPLEMWHHESTFFYGAQAYYVEDGVKPLVEADEIGELMCPDNRVVFFKNHGALIAAESLEHCTIEALCLEKSCEYAVQALSIGGTPMDERESRVISSALQTFKDDMWAANVRRLRRSDPDLFELIDE